MKLRKVFALVPDCHVEGWRYGPVWRRHFYEGIAEAGVAVDVPTGVDFDWARPLRTVDTAAEERRRATSDELRRQIEESVAHGADAVLSCCFAGDLTLGLVEDVRSRGTPWVNFFCDSLHAFDRVAPLAERMDLNWFVETGARSRYAALGVPSMCAPYALNPDALPDASCAMPLRELHFIGAAHRDRIATATLLRMLGADLTIRGSGWESVLGRGDGLSPKALARSVARRALRGRVGPYVPDDVLEEHLKGCRVLLGLSQSGGRTGLKAGYLKLRDLELPGMGCCYLAQHSADLETVYDIGTEVVTFRTVAEAARRARRLAADPARCLDLGRRARARVLRSHTWQARLPQIEDALA